MRKGKEWKISRRGYAEGRARPPPSATRPAGPARGGGPPRKHTLSSWGNPVGGGDAPTLPAVLHSEQSVLFSVTRAFPQGELAS